MTIYGGMAVFCLDDFWCVFGVPDLKVSDIGQNVAKLAASCHDDLQGKGGFLLGRSLVCFCCSG